VSEGRDLELAFNDTAAHLQVLVDKCETEKVRWSSLSVQDHFITF